MKLKLLTKDISLLFVLLGVFFFPFNSYQGIPALGEFFRDSCLIFFLIAGFCLLSRRKFSIPHNTSIFQMVTILIFWFFLTGIFNTFDMMHYSFKHLSGIERFLRQFISLILVTSLLLIFYNVFKNHSINELFLKIRKAIL